MRQAFQSVTGFVRGLLLAGWVTAGCSGIFAANLVNIPALGLRVAPGFRVTLYADSTLADDIYAMTIDSQGNVVVSGPGYIRTLYDDDGDGVADSAIDFANPATGAMGLCFGGNYLYFTGGGFLQRYPDADGDRLADGPAEQLLPLKFAEHGGHAIRKGPDGLWYIIAGNETKFGPEHITHGASPVGKIEGGALLRCSADGRRSEAIAHGFRNPYSFDFNAAGDVFTYDSDCEGDYFLPWYTPTRLYHIGYAGHHGWRLDGWTRSWPRPDYYFDTVEIMEEIGRGSPTGVTCYRHVLFPPYYRNGLFFADWTFGRVYFAPLQLNGASYLAAPESFIEPMGTHGFAPSDLAVGTDGSLFISIGGRKTRGAVYRVQYVADATLIADAASWRQTLLSDMDAVFFAPQPLDSWSRAYWEPLALNVGNEAFQELVANSDYFADSRVRAIEVVTDLFGGLTPEAAAAAAQANSPFVRARAAWSLGRAPCANFGPMLLALTRDQVPIVRRFAMEAIGDRISELDVTTLQAAIAANMAHPEKRLRQDAARIASLLPEPAWNALWAQQQRAAAPSRLTATLAALWRAPAGIVPTNAIESALAILPQTRAAEYRLEAIRLIILGLGDYHLRSPSLEVYTGYEPANPLADQDSLAAKIRRVVGAGFPYGDNTVDFESARLLAMMEADDPALPGKLLSKITDRTAASVDFHYLTALSRLKAPPPKEPRLPAAILALDRKLARQEQRSRLNWTARLLEVVQSLLRRDPALADAIIKQPGFATAGHLPLVPALGSERFVICARIYLNTLQQEANFPWSTGLVDLLSALPSEEVLPFFRRQWSNLTLRDRLLLELARHPQLVDRDKFVTGLGSLQPEVVRACMGALLGLPRDESRKALLPAMRLVHRSMVGGTHDQATRAQAVLLINHQAETKFNIQEPAPDLKRAYQPLFDWFAAKYPSLVPQLDSDDAENTGKWNYLFKTVPWQKGNPFNGELIFANRCATCHSGGAPVGPDLAGVAQRLSPVDLFNAIIFPSRDIAPPYRQTTFTTRAGETYTGLIAFESADGVIVRTAAGATVRLADGDIASRVQSPVSPMPSGLLEGLKTQELADLFGYLKTLAPAR